MQDRQWWKCMEVGRGVPWNGRTSYKHRDGVRVKMLLDAAFCKNVFLALYLLSRVITGLVVGCLRFNSPIFILNYYYYNFLFIVP